MSGREHVQEEEEVEIKEHVHVLSWETGGFLCPKGTEQDQLPNLKPELSPHPTPNPRGGRKERTVLQGVLCIGTVARACALAHVID